MDVPIELTVLLKPAFAPSYCAVFERYGCIVEEIGRINRLAQYRVTFPVGTQWVSQHPDRSTLLVPGGLVADVLTLGEHSFIFAYISYSKEISAFLADEKGGVN